MTFLPSGARTPEAGSFTTSVIIRTKNEAHALGTTLETVLSQSLPPDEILVIDSGSTDGTVAVAERFPVRILTITPAEWGYARALNRAAAESTGELLVCLSSHCVPVHDGWLKAMVGHFSDDRVAGVWGGQLRPGRPVPPPQPPIVQEPGSYGRHNWTFGMSNANSCVRRELWERLPFDESMPATEDKAWGRAALDLGYCMIFEPTAAVWHARHSPVAAYRRQRAVMKGYALMFPENSDGFAQQLARAGSAAARTARLHARTRDTRALWSDLKRAPTSLAAIVGGLTARKGSRGAG